MCREMKKCRFVILNLVVLFCLFYKLELTYAADSSKQMNVLVVTGANECSIGSERIYKLFKSNHTSYNMNVYQFNSVNKTIDQLKAKFDSTFICGPGGEKNTVNVLYYTGHGAVSFHGVSKLDTLLRGACEDSYINGLPLTNTYRYYDLVNDLCKYKGKFIVVMDCCGSGSIISYGLREKSSEGRISQKKKDKFIAILTSTPGYFEESGYFLRGCTPYTIEINALMNNNGGKKADTDKNGFISIKELHNYLTSNSTLQRNCHGSMIFPREGSNFNLFQTSTVRLNKTDIELNVGDSIDVKASIIPYDANQTLKWEVVSDSVAKVYPGKKSAKVKGIKPGQTVCYVRILNPSAQKCVGTTGILRITVKNSVPYQKITKVENVKDGIKITWPKSSKAKGYYIYRKTGSESWKRICTIKNNSTVSCLDKTAENGKLYSYTVSGFIDSQEGLYNKTGLTVFRLKPISITTCESKKQREVNLVWNKNSAVTGYQILYSNDSTLKSNVKKVKVIGNNNTRYTVKGLSGGKTYYFRIQPYRYVNGKNYFGGLCDVKKAKVQSGTSDSGGGCVTPDTLITLADGSQKRVDMLKNTDVIKAYDFDKGCIVDAPMTLYHHVEEKEQVLRVSFSDGTSIGVVKDHCFFDLTDRCYVLIKSEEQEENLKGHKFAILNDDKISEIELVEIKSDGITDSYYAPVSEVHLNCFANGLMNMPGYVSGFCNLFVLEKNELKYDAAEKEKEIKKAVEMMPDSFSYIMNLKVFKDNKLDWLSVSVARGLISVDELKQVYEFCLPYFIS